MKKVVFLLAIIGWSFSGFSQVNMDSISIDTVISLSPTAVSVHLTVYGMLAPGLPANVSVDKGICPSYNSLGVTIPTAVTVTGNSTYTITVTGLPTDTCLMFRGKVAGGNAAGFSAIYTFINAPAPPCNFTPSITGADTICEGLDFATLHAFPFGADHYQWKKDGVLLPGDTTSLLNYITTSGTYRVLITKDNCTDSAEKTVTFIPSPTITGYSISGGTLIVSGHFHLPVIIKVAGTICVPAYIDTTQIILVGMNNIHTGDVILVEYPNGCWADTTILITGIEEIQFQEKGINSRIINIQGQEVKPPFKPGVYFQGPKKFVILKQ